MTDFTAILKWYKGKALAAVRDEAIPLLQASEAQGYWIPKASRRVGSLLRKTNRKLCVQAANEADQILDSGRVKGWHILHGLFDLAPVHLQMIRERCAQACGPAVPDGPMSHLQWCLDFAPIAELITQLDIARPKPAYVFKEISPAVFANVGKEMGLIFDSVRQPEIIWRKEISKNKAGKDVTVWWADIIWPEGTRHNMSKFSYGSKAGNSQCQACGHAIRNNGNWVPLLLDGFVQVNGERAPVSLWVGRDCARNLFGCVVNGETEFKR